MEGKTPINVFIYRCQGIFNANVFSELVVHTESKMIIFTSGPLQGFRLFFRKIGSVAEMIDVHQNLGFVKTFLR